MSNPLRIGFFVGTFPVLSETFILRQITGLIDLGHAIEIFADTRGDTTQPEQPEIPQYDLLKRTTWMDMPPETAPWEMPVRPITGRTWPPGASRAVPNVTRLALALPKLLRSFIAAPKLCVQLLQPKEYSYRASSLSGIYRLAKLAGHPGKFDVIHAHFGPTGNSYRFARSLWRAPLVVSFHGYDFSTLPRREGPNIYEKLFSTADAITVNSQYTRTQIEKLGCSPQKIHLSPVGLNPEQFKFSERTLKPGEPLKILTVGRLVEVKGHEYVLRAIARLREKYPAVRYAIAGDGPLRKPLEALINQLGLQEIVTLHGAMNGNDIKQLMAQAHLFVLASVNVAGDQEGQGLVLQEAQACGLPIIATQHGALPEGILPGESGFLVPERDPEALAERFLFLAQHPDRWPKMGTAGRKIVERKYDVRRLNFQLVELYQNLISEYQHCYASPGNTINYESRVQRQ